MTYTHRKTLFEVASLNLRSILAYLHRELGMPSDMIRVQVNGVLQSFAIEDIHRETDRLNGPEGQR